MSNPTDYKCERCDAFVSYADKQHNNGETDGYRFAVDRRLAESEIIHTKKSTKRFERVILCRSCWAEFENMVKEFLVNE